MLSQAESTQRRHRCALCNGENFYLEDGYYFCSKCQTQNEDIREEVHETRYDTTTRLRKIKIKSEKSEKTDIVGWTSWELYNFTLIGIYNELVEIGVDPNIKLTILQLWTSYLSKLEVAFTSTTKKSVPKMARRFHKKDAEIIYGKIQQKKKRKQKKQSSNSASSLMSSFTSDGSVSKRQLNKSKRLLASSEYDKYLQSQGSSDTDGLSSLNQSLYSLKSSISEASSTAIKIRFNKKAKLETRKVKVLSTKVPRAKRMNYRKKHVTTQYATGPDIVTPLKLWSIVYLALRIDNQDVYISDMLRFSREGHLSYYKLDHLLPPEIILNKCDINLLTQTSDITHKGLRRSAASIAKFLNINELAKPNLLKLIKRYCEDLELPKGVFLYVERMFLSSPAVMHFTAKCPLIPNYEGRAMAYVIVVLKILFGLDNITEKEISRVIEKINRIANERGILTGKLFNFCEWQRFLECRKSVLTNLHFPSKIKYDPECVGTSHLYLRFMGLMKSKREAEPPEITNYKHVLSQNLVDALNQCVDRLNDNTLPMSEMEVFSPSFTPLRSYINQLTENPHYEMPHLLKTNFYEMKIGYMTRPDSLIDLAFQCGIKLAVVDRSLQYLEKIVPPFEQPRMPSLMELSELVRVETPTTKQNYAAKKSENLLDYSHKNRACKLKVNFDIFKYYSSIFNVPLDFDESLDLNEDCCFDRILPDGRLNISDDSDSEDENTSSQLKEKEVNWEDNTCLLDKKFCKKYNITLYNHEEEAIMSVKKPLKEKYNRCRDASGKFVKSSSINRCTKKNSPGSQTKKKELNETSQNSSEDEVVVRRTQAKKKKSKKTDLISSEEEVIEVPIDCFSDCLSDISILQDETDTNTQNTSLEDNDILFRPYKDYWMYHCIFSRVKGKNFELFEKELPENFLWLLNECANIIEMTTEDLYEEVCLIEAYHFNILKTKKSKNDSDYEFHDCKSKSYTNNILNKW